MPISPSTNLGRSTAVTTHHRTWVEIDAAHLTQNFHAIQHAAGMETTSPADVLAVIKADAYGHSAELCAPVLARAGARFLGVTDAAEGARVRQALDAAGPPDQNQLQILIMCGSLPGDTPAIAAHNLTPVVWTPAHIHALADVQHLQLHIEIDTGMGRQGAKPGPELHALLETIHSNNLAVTGLFTHLCSSEIPHSPTTTLQKQRFEAAVAEVRAAGLQPKLLHIANSSAVDHPADTQAWLSALAQNIGATPMVRTGLALYGYTLPTDPEPTTNPASPAPTLGQVQPHIHPVLTWHARILSTHTLAPGDTVGYGATSTATHPTRVALLPIGYADGLRRELSNPSPTTNAAAAPYTAVILEQSSRISVFRPATEPSQSTSNTALAHTPDGTPCPILGRISMNLTVIDISAAPHLTPGDPVTLLGPHFTAADHARLAQTIPYEILCALRPLPHILTNTP